MSETPEVSIVPEQPEQHKGKGYAVVVQHEAIHPLHKEIVVAAIRLEYLKLAIIVVLVMIIVWYVYSRINKMNRNDVGEHMYTRRPQGSHGPTGAQSTVPFQSGWFSGQSRNRNGIARPLGQINGHTGNNNERLRNDIRMVRTNEPPTSQSTVPFQSGWFSGQSSNSDGIARPLGQINREGMFNSDDNREDFAPYASWLVPDIYRSDPSHDDHLASKSHYGMYAPYNLDYIFPDNIDPPNNRGNTVNNKGIRSREPNVHIPYGQGPPEHLVAYNQHELNPDTVASELDVPERQLEGEAGLLFGLTNLPTTPVAQGGPL